MSNSGVNGGFARCFILFMSIVILLQGGVFLGLSIIGITMEKCTNEVTDVSEKPFEFILDLIYFANEDCGNPILNIPAVSAAHEIDIDWVKSFEITNRMNIFLITYATISSLWIITSLLVLTTICGVVTKIVSAVCYWPWFLVVMAGSVLDAVATGYHIVDIYHTTSANDALEYVGVTINDEEIMKAFNNIDAYFITPAIVMTCISSRVVLIWFLNIFGTIFCLSLANVLAKRTAAENKINESAFVVPQSETTTRGVDLNLLQDQLQPNEPPQQQVSDKTATQYMEKNPPQIKPKPLLIQTPAQIQRQNTYQPQQANPYQRGDSQIFETSVTPTSFNNNKNDLLITTPTNQISNTTSEVPTYRNTDTHPDRLDYPLQSQPTSRELSPITPLNNRYSISDRQQFSNPQRVSGELRSHLPWSYTSMLSNTQPTKRVQPQAPPPSNVYPNVPEPDYTLHPQRSELSKSAESDINIMQPQSYSRW